MPTRETTNEQEILDSVAGSCDVTALSPESICDSDQERLPEHGEAECPPDDKDTSRGSCSVSDEGIEEIADNEPSRLVETPSSRRELESSESGTVGVSSVHATAAVPCVVPPDESCPSQVITIPFQGDDDVDTVKTMEEDIESGTIDAVVVPATILDQQALEQELTDKILNEYVLAEVLEPTPCCKEWTMGQRFLGLLILMVIVGGASAALYAML